MSKEKALALAAKHGIKPLTEDALCWVGDMCATQVQLAQFYAEARADMAEEIRLTWNAARAAGNQTEAFRILERMVDRLAYGRTDNNPSLAIKEPQ